MRAFALLAAVALAPAAQDEKSAFEKDPQGWQDLMPGKDLKGWRRVPIDPLASKTVWSVSEDGTMLLVDGVNAKEMLLEETERGDGIFHVEWRFRKGEGAKPVYNGGVYVRTALDGKVWVQAQVAEQEKPPVCGDLFALMPGAEKPATFLQKAPPRAKPIGEWNTYEVTCKGKSVSVWVNGATTVTWDGCEWPKGHVGLQAEFAFLEVRRLKFKPL
jgi:hypothetical protein